MADNNGRRDIHLNNLIPKRRKSGEIWAVIIIIVFIASLYCIINVLPFGEETEVCYSQDIKTKQTNDSQCKYTRRGLWSVSTIVALLFLCAVLGTIIDRLCLVNEERNHLATRYDKCFHKMLAACFSGITWSFVILITCAAVAIILVINPVVSHGSLVTIVLGGSLVVPLVRLFNSNTLSLVEVSRTLEDNERSVANGLAWSYYFGYLEIILPGLKERLQERDLNLSSEKLFILLPLDCNIREKVEDVDRNIAEADDGDVELVTQRGGLARTFTNKVHCIRFNGATYSVLLEYCSTLETLRKMSIPGRIRALGEEEMIEQAKLFCQKLQVGILENPLNVECQGRCELVIYDSKTLEEQGMTLAGLLAERIGEQQERGGEQLRDGLQELDEEAERQRERDFPEEEHGGVQEQGVVHEPMMPVVHDDSTS